MIDDCIDSRVTQSLQLTRRSNKLGHLGDEEDDDSHDPFAEIGDDFNGDADDLETNLLRDKWATICANISRLVDLLQPSTSATSLIVACDDLVSFLTRKGRNILIRDGKLAMLKGSPDLGLESHFVSCHGMLA